MSKDNLQLPKTAFSMKASLPTKEPQILAQWDKRKFSKSLEKNLMEKKNLFFMTVLLMQMDIFIWELC